MILKRIAKALVYVAVILIISAFVCKKETGEQQPLAGVTGGFAVVELFTSEGCSSCPPADRLIGAIAEKYKNQPVYLLAYHVDYWDHQGWKDKYSNSQYSLRQQQYSNMLHSQIYTPQLIVNGKVEMAGSDGRAVEHAVQTALAASSNSSIDLSVKLSPAKADVMYKATSTGLKQDLLISLIEKKSNSYIKRGENKGLDLVHWQIVHQQKQIPLTNSSDGMVSFKLPRNFDSNNWELVGMVQHTKTGEIIGAVKLPFNESKYGSN
ncbi:DUF1223 domain-containing protein [Niabella yanshanensis]|uniref:DUF1223 domain-containing protein n=1 Tax=Niabella yanshanensis TaxID=577386 RepID=A0ABZ0WCW7_9BACT|nr:DUF1223 domain-containing protein [Niabella yanshanensis]WQD40376.1 DUF1223 domain-containing protein [Niabella yanshanensis]